MAAVLRKWPSKVFWHFADFPKHRGILPEFFQGDKLEKGVRHAGDLYGADIRFANRRSFCITLASFTSE